MVVDSAGREVEVSCKASCELPVQVRIRSRGGARRRNEASGKILGEGQFETCRSALHMRLPAPLETWSTSQPTLYEAVVKLGDGVDEVTQHFARRTVAVKNGLHAMEHL
eukprot:5145001-Amphidinium_carterae.1